MSTVESDSEWFVDCSDEEIYRIEPSDMRQMYETISQSLANRTPLSLEWKPPRRKRAPPPETPLTAGEALEETKSTSEAANTEDPSVAVVPEFDFDDVSSELKTVRPARRSSGATPRTKKRVARLDKIMNDMLRHKKLDEEANKPSPAPSSQHASSTKSNSPRTPQQRRTPSKS